MNVLGIIAARGGSKRLPGKNIRPLAGRPLIAWTVAAAIESGVVDRLLVSTDSPEIETAAREAGAEVPFRRPESLATDAASGTDVILHALRWFENTEGIQPRWILCLQTTSPLRTAADIRALLAVAESKGWHEVASFRPAASGSGMTWCIDADSIAMRDKELSAGSWKGELNGAMYLIERDLFVERGNFFTEHLRAFPMPAERSVDIDTLEDFERAEALMTVSVR